MISMTTRKKEGSLLRYADYEARLRAVSTMIVWAIILVVCVALVRC